MLKRIASADLETDPFAHNQMIYPFVAGFYDGTVYKPFWSDNCVDELFTFLADYKDPLIVYFHNGGRFDFFYCMKYLNAANMKIINNRIVQATFKHHELRDSFAIMPFALATYKKTPIDYANFVRSKRDRHRDEIISYLRDDCVDLHTLCTTFHQEFGDKLTIGSASMAEFKKFHQFSCGNGEFDKRFRDSFYFGGRNQCFQSGVIEGPWKVYDVNSMYPDVMRSYLHPVSTGIVKGNKIDEKTCFVSCEGWNRGAFPTRNRDGGLDFTVPYGTFHTTIHEFNAAIETGSFECRRIIETRGFNQRENFAEFIDHFYNARLHAKESGDVIRTIFYKFVMNSCYGKFAQNPENYCDFFLTHLDDLPPDWHDCDKSCVDDCRARWTPSFSCEEWIIWSRPLQRLSYYNIAIGASITGAARSVLLRGIAKASGIAYCDTDSIICKQLADVDVSNTRLGSWKLEAEGQTIAIAGKKLYALFDGTGACIKKAHKGAKLSGYEILSIARGSTVEYPNPVPTFKWDGSHSFTKRRIKKTA